VRDRIGFYYVGVFLIDESKEHAVLTAATGEVGQKLLEIGHKLRIGETGIVGFTAGSGQSLIVLDVEDDIVYHPQPLLPETRLNKSKICSSTSPTPNSDVNNLPTSCSVRASNN